MFVAMIEQVCPVDLLAYCSLSGALCKGDCVEEAKKSFTRYVVEKS